MTTANAKATATPKKRLPRKNLPAGLQPDTLAVREGLPATQWGEASFEWENPQP